MSIVAFGGGTSRPKTPPSVSGRSPVLLEEPLGPEQPCGLTEPEREEQHSRYLSETILELTVPWILSKSQCLRTGTLQHENHVKYTFKMQIPGPGPRRI